MSGLSQESILSIRGHIAPDRPDQRGMRPEKGVTHLRPVPGIVPGGIPTLSRNQLRCQGYTGHNEG
ncbi:MAG: hypothetical protein HQL77_11855 [Magnetococcales bacterium]|nr:hypothetical protein [Magnetococcales bacterium]